ncbi:MAG: flotillin family protein [Alphaproteobacteria bacterium]|nr:flotillin family protein [Alphaproteobacteria bacterium]MCB9691745.1 flotillin family protein [Alphaproteobacteria bacterium]
MTAIALIFGVLAALGVGGVLAALGLANNLLYICEPNEVLVFSGTGAEGYRIIKGGRGWRIPLIESVDRLDLTNMIIEVNVSAAYSKGGIPLNVQGVANVKIDGLEPNLGNAVERLLSKRREEIVRMAKDVLEGNLRGVLSQLTPEQVNEDKIMFAQKLLEEADHDLARLGLKLDTMKIQNVHDDRGYLDSIGRKSSAEIIRNSRIAEARAKAAAIKRDAENRQRARLQQVDAEQQITVAQVERRIVDARTRTKALVAEQEGQVRALIAKAKAGIDAEEARVEQVRRQLEADVLEPARARMEAGIAEAKGRSSKILEEGRATTQVLEEMIKVWQTAGPNARDIFLMQKLQVVMGAMVSTIGNVKIDKVTMLPKSEGGGSTAVSAVKLVEELKGALGVDLPRLLESAAGVKRDTIDAP